MSQLLQQMDKAFSEVHEGNIMIRSLYQICQRDGESMEEYMLQIHKAVVVICHTYPERLADQGKNLIRDHFYNGLVPLLCEALGFAVANLPKRE